MTIESKKIIFLGQKPLGEACFEMALNNTAIEIVGVVTNAHIEGTWWQTNNIYTYCINNNIQCIENNKRNEQAILDLIHDTKPDYLISVQHPWILSPRLLQSVAYKALNLHMARLPDYRGWNGFSHAIINNDSTYGVTLHWISDLLDLGDNAYEQSLPIAHDDTAYSLYKKSMQVSIKLFAKMLQDLLIDNIPRYPQATGGKLYGKNSLDEYRFIPADKLRECAAIIRALYFPPYPPPYTILDGQEVQLLPTETK